MSNITTNIIAIIDVLSCISCDAKLYQLIPSSSITSLRRSGIMAIIIETLAKMLSVIRKIAKARRVRKPGILKMYGCQAPTPEELSLELSLEDSR